MTTAVRLAHLVAAALFLLSGAAIRPSFADDAIEDCDPEMIGFEIVTGYVYTAPTEMMDSLPGTLMLTDCLETCQMNDSCQSINYETGLCVLFSSNADVFPGALTKSQFPVFTIYAQKSCLGVKPCERAWCFDRVEGYQLQGHTRKRHQTASRQDCLELCLGEREFPCRSANYNNGTGECALSDMDRHTVVGSHMFQETENMEYLENNCVEDPVKLCEFKRLQGRILKTVDSVYQDVGSLEECKELCLNSPYRCHSFDYGDTGDLVCRLSHHSRSTLSHIQEPYLDVPEASTYELSSCYNVTIDCRSGDMVARIKTSKLFNGKIYAKGSPNSCVEDIDNSLEFELRMSYNDVECNIKRQGLGKYYNDVVIQHHDMIVTSADLGLAVTCQYDLTNKSVSNEIDLQVRGEVQPALSEEIVVDSPNVAMKITDRRGLDLPSAEVGDPLTLRFEIIDRNSPYEIFVRDLVAMDGIDSNEILLVDSDGCPTDHFIMGPLLKSTESGKILLSNFDAFKFPSSEIVQFRALVTPCMPTCEPVICDLEETTGELRTISSYGRKRRAIGDSVSRPRRNTEGEELLVVQSIHISDKFGFEKDKKRVHENHRQNNYAVDNSTSTVFLHEERSGLCINLLGLIIACTMFLVAQLAVIAGWTFLWQRRRKVKETEALANVSTSSLSKLYDTGYARRF